MHFLHQTIFISIIISIFPTAIQYFAIFESHQGRWVQNRPWGEECIWVVRALTCPCTILLGLLTCSGQPDNSSSPSHSKKANLWVPQGALALRPQRALWWASRGRSTGWSATYLHIQRPQTERSSFKNGEDCMGSIHHLGLEGGGRPPTMACCKEKKFLQRKENDRKINVVPVPQTYKEGWGSDRPTTIHKGLWLTKPPRKGGGGA